MARLTIVEGGRKRIYDICEDVVRIGSSSDNNIELGDPDAARNHCEIRRTARGYRVIDLESKSGTRVNGQFVNHKALEPGDEIGIGGAVVRFETGASGEVAAPRSPGAGARGGRRPVSARPAPRAIAVTPGRLRSRENEDGEDGGRRFRREPTGLPGWARGAIAGGSAIVVFLGVLAIINSAGSDDPGVAQIRQARSLFEQDEYEAALQKLAAVDEIPGVPDWAVREKERLREECQKHIDARVEWGLFQQATEDLNEIIRFSNQYPIEVAEINRKLDAVARKYEGKADVLTRIQPKIDHLRERFPLE